MEVRELLSERNRVRWNLRKIANKEIACPFQRAAEFAASERVQTVVLGN